MKFLFGHRINFASLPVIAFAIIFFNAHFCKAQSFETDYAPVVCKGSVPDDWKLDRKSLLIKQLDLAKTSDKEDIAKATKFYNEINDATEKILSNGDIYYNDPFTGYVRQVAAPVVSAAACTIPIKVFVKRDDEVNAYSLASGVIIINIGLLAELNSEAQLAYIIAHEIAHIKRQHSYLSYQNNLKMKNLDINYYSDKSIINRYSSYSKENEFEADAKGLEYLAITDYNLTESIFALKVLDFDSIRQPINISQMMTNDFFNFDSIYNSSDAKSGGGDFLIISDNSSNHYTSDKIETHPEIDRRILSLNELIKSLELDSKKGSKYLVSESQFTTVKQSAAFEVVENTYRNQYYLESIFCSLMLQQKYPGNNYLNFNLIRCVKGICDYASLNSRTTVLKWELEKYSPAVDTLNKALSSFTESNLYKYCYGKLKQLEISEPGNEDVVFYNALIAESYIGKDVANILYKKYIIKFPNGKYISYASSKTED